jgi:hypothetical protein
MREAAAWLGYKEAAGRRSAFQLHPNEGALSIGCSCGVNLAVDDDAQAKALRLRMYVLCAECARLIDLSEGNLPRRQVEAVDMTRHTAEEHDSLLEMLGVNQ